MKDAAKKLARVAEMVEGWSVNGGASELERDLALELLREIYTGVKFGKPDGAAAGAGAAGVRGTAGVTGITGAGNAATGVTVGCDAGPKHAPEPEEEGFVGIATGGAPEPEAGHVASQTTEALDAEPQMPDAPQAEIETPQTAGTSQAEPAPEVRKPAAGDEIIARRAVDPKVIRSLYGDGPDEDDGGDEYYEEYAACPALETVPEAETGPESWPELKQEPESEFGAESGRSREPELKPEQKPELKPEPKPEQKPEPKPEPKPKPKQDASSGQGYELRPKAPSGYEPGVELKPEPKPEQKPGPVIESAENNKTTLGDILNRGRHTLGETLRNGEKDMASRIAAAERPALRRSIGIGDRFMMIRDLFDGNAGAFDDAIERLDAFQSLDEAIIYIHDTYEWNADSRGARLLVELLERKLG
jgi:hypothetical protein